MTSAIRRQDLTEQIVWFCSDKSSSSSFGMSTNNTSTSTLLERRQDRHSNNYDFHINTSKGCDETSSLEEDTTPRGARRKGLACRLGDTDVQTTFKSNVLPPLHPHPTAQTAHSSFRRSRTLSSDTLVSMGSSIVSVDAGKHGFITHDDASSTGSLVLAYEQGKDTPPSEYDLPKSIIRVFDAAAMGDDESTRVRAVTNEEEFHKLPYQIRSRLNLSQQDKQGNNHKSHGWSNIPNISDLIVGYGAMEAGQRTRGCDTGNYYPVPEFRSSVNDLCYSTETSPFIGKGNPRMNQSSIPLQLPTSIFQAQFPLHEKLDEANNTRISVYFSSLVILSVFVGITYGLFYLMKMMV